VATAKQAPLSGYSGVAISKVVSVGSLLTLLTAVVGGAFFASSLETTVTSAVEDLRAIKGDIREMRDLVSKQSNGLTALQVGTQAQDLRIERLEGEIGELGKRVRELEMKKRDD